MIERVLRTGNYIELLGHNFSILNVKCNVINIDNFSVF